MPTTRAVFAVMICAMLSGCGDTPPNHKVSGKVASVTWVRPGCTAPKILLFLIGCGEASYTIELGTPPVRVYLAASKTTDGDMRAIIGEQVTAQCFRSGSERQNECTNWLVSLNFRGREVVR